MALVLLTLFWQAVKGGNSHLDRYGIRTIPSLLDRGFYYGYTQACYALGWLGLVR